MCLVGILCQNINTMHGPMNIKCNISCYIYIRIQIVQKDALANTDFLHYAAYTCSFNPLKPELNSICYLLALLGAHHFLHFSRIRVKLLTFRLLMSYIYGAPILDVSRSHTTTQTQSVGLLWTSDQLVAKTST